MANEEEMVIAFYIWSYIRYGVMIYITLNYMHTSRITAYNRKVR